MVRGDVFEKRMLNRIFRTLWMIPVYRIRDGFSTLTRNGDSFRECYDLFERNGRVLIFSEGVCVQKKQIQPIRKGTARLALDFLKTDTNKELYIVPMANSYTRFRQFRSTVMTQFGKPIKASDYKELMSQNENKAYMKLTEDITESLEKNFIQETDYSDKSLTEKALMALRFNRWERRKNWMIEDDTFFRTEKQLVEKLENPQAKKLSADWENNFDALPAPWQSEGILKAANNRIIRTAILAVLFPFVAMASAFHYLPFKLANWVIKNKIKDIIFHDTILILGTAIFYLAQWIIICLALVSYFGFNGFVTAIAIAALTIINTEIADDFYFYWFNRKNLKDKGRYQALYNEIEEVLAS